MQDQSRRGIVIEYLDSERLLLTQGRVGELHVRRVAGKVWDFELVDSADITGDMECFEMEPMNELKVGQDVALRSIVKSCNQDEASIWYAQVNSVRCMSTAVALSL